MFPNKESVGRHAQNLLHKQESVCVYSIDSECINSESLSSLFHTFIFLDYMHHASCFLFGKRIMEDHLLSFLLV